MEPAESGPVRVLRDRYELLHPLGKGGMGEVFAALDRRHGRRVALKIIGAGERHESAAQRFEREAAAVARLSHPHVAQLLDHVGATATEPALIVMELLDGETLGSLLRRHSTLEPDRALDIAAQIADALGAAHRAGIVHRDIKPENVFLVRTSARGDFVKVLDFGIARIAGLRGVTSTDEIVGTVEYMSPEQAMGDHDIGPASDVFSLGVLLYRMLSGELPHTADTMRGILGNLFSGSLVPLDTRRPGLSSAIVEVVTRCLALAPADRFADGVAVAAALRPLREPGAASPLDAEPRRRAQEPAPSEAGKPPVDGRPIASTRIAPRRFVRAAVIGGVAALAGAVMIGRRGGDAPAVAPSPADAMTSAASTPAPTDAPSAAPTLDAATPPAVTVHSEPDPTPTSRAKPAQKRVQAIDARGTAIEFERFIPAAEWTTVHARWKAMHADVTAAIAHCYAGTPIEAGHQTDTVKGTLRDGRLAVGSHTRAWRGRRDLAQPTSEVKTCVASGLAQLEWPTASEPATVEIAVVMSTESGQPLK